MANTSTIYSLDELTDNAISAIRKSQKRPGETRIYDFIKIFIENCDTDNSLFWERMKYHEENEVIYNKPIKNENSFYISKRDRETSPIGQTPVINSLNNSISPPRPPRQSLLNEQRY